jgi:hypothetical protein
VTLLRTCEAQADQATIEAAGTGNTSDHTLSLYKIDRALSAYNRSTASISQSTAVSNATVAHIDLVPEQKHLHSDAAVPDSSDLEAAQKTHVLRHMYAKDESLLAAAPNLGDIALCTVCTLDRLEDTGEVEDSEPRVARRIHL